MKCLFENYKLQPKKLSEICDKYLERMVYDGLSFKECKEFLNEVEKIGFTFDYEMDAEPFNLRAIKNN